MKPFQTTILLDSGAFSAWKQGKPININDYIAFINKYKHLIDQYVALDVIPGKDGLIDRRQEALDYSAQASIDNLKIMHEAGLNPIPVFHQGERFVWLEKLIEMGEPYIGISPYLRSHRSEIVKWMDNCFSIATDSSGKPLIKTHGFGVTSTLLCSRYPWFTVDSASWAIGAGMGNVEIPIYTNGNPDFNHPRSPFVLHITSRDTAVKSGSFDSLSEMEQESVMQFLRDVDVSIGELRNSWMHRVYLRIAYYQMMEAACVGTFTFKNKQSTFFNPSISKKSPYKPWKWSVIFSVGTSALHNQALTDWGVTRRLLSYFYIRDAKEGFLEHYRNTGLLLGHKEGKLRKANWDSESYLDRRRTQMLARMKQDASETN